MKFIYCLSAVFAAFKPLQDYSHCISFSAPNSAIFDPLIFR